MSKLNLKFKNKFENKVLEIISEGSEEFLGVLTILKL